jgi:hypothetical protein
MGEIRVGMAAEKGVRKVHISQLAEEILDFD